jgi:hypothetical protein
MEANMNTRLELRDKPLFSPADFTAEIILGPPDDFV